MNGLFVDGVSESFYNQTKITVVSDIGSDIIHSLWEGVARLKPEAEQFSEVIFLNLHLKLNDYGRGQRSKCEGSKILEEITLDPNSIVFIFSPLACLRDAVLVSKLGKNSLLHLLEKNPMVQFLNITPLSPEKVVKAIERALVFSVKKKPIVNGNWVTAGEVLFQRGNYRYGISRLIHDLKPNSDIALERAKSAFPDMPYNIEEAKEYLRLRMSLEKEELPASLKGKNVKGLFVDAAGTLFKDDLSGIKDRTLLEEIINESNSRWVYVWTAGPVSSLYEAVWDLDMGEAFGNIPLIPKQNFSGLSVEETIDDLTEQEMQGVLGVKTLKHRLVS
ncbi:MAG: hypothetical protein PHE77_03085 [Candidatus Pacebacteria bacterium]|nr:hypothetical protein [Candidatus Paceibacterota bacterium]